jgi:hypothetical protein
LREPAHLRDFGAVGSGNGDGTNGLVSQCVQDAQVRPALGEQRPTDESEGLDQYGL